MRKVKVVYIGTFVLLMFAMAAFFSCSSSTPNTTAATVSSTSAQFVTCPGTPAADVSITTTPAFVLNSVSIAVNNIVKWTNNDSTDHTVTSGVGAFDGKFDSGHIAPTATVCIQFLAPGSYNYFCNIHPFMTGTVTVQ